ncbi:MAG: DUF4345 family protein [Pseudomonadota bacterium]
MQITLDVLVGIAALMLTGLGAMSMFAPRRMIANFGLEPTGELGLSTLRSVIGGLFLASVALLLIGLTTGRTEGYVAVSIVMAAVAFGRLVGIAFDGFDKAVLPPLIVEIVIIAVLMTAYHA